MRSMRWRFVDPAHPGEVAAKERVLRKIDAWWAEFARRAGDLERVFKRQLEMDLPGWMREHLDAVDERLCWEFGPPLRGAGHRLVVTAESYSQLRPLVTSLLERAPSLPGWEFYPYRPRESVEEALRTVEGRVGRAYEDVQARVLSGKHNRIDLTFRSAAFASAEDESANQAAFVLTESLLGEDALDRWVGTIEVEPAPRPGPRLFGRKEPAAERGELLALDRVQPAFAARVGAIQEGLPRTPWHEVDTENHPWSSFEIEPEEKDDWPCRSDLIVGITPFVELAQAIFDGSFRSERFSRFGETFCYLKIDGIDGLDPAHFADRGDLEYAIDEVLIPARLGRTIGGGTGRRYSYVELALADVERALPLLRGRLQAGKVPRRSWLLFHDGELADEWVGLHEDTPPPPGMPALLG
jgi:hypothetical protein